MSTEHEREPVGGKLADTGMHRYSCLATIGSFALAVGLMLFAIGLLREAIFDWNHLVGDKTMRFYGFIVEVLMIIFCLFAASIFIVIGVSLIRRHKLRVYNDVKEEKVADREQHDPPRSRLRDFPKPPCSRCQAGMVAVTTICPRCQFVSTSRLTYTPAQTCPICQAEMAAAEFACQACGLSVTSESR